MWSCTDMCKRLVKLHCGWKSQAVTSENIRSYLVFSLSLSVVDVENNACALHFISNLMMLSKQMETFVSVCPTFSGDCNPSNIHQRKRICLLDHGYDSVRERLTSQSGFRTRTSTASPHMYMSVSEEVKASINMSSAYGCHYSSWVRGDCAVSAFLNVEVCWRRKQENINKTVAQPNVSLHYGCACGTMTESLFVLMSKVVGFSVVAHAR